MDRRRLVLRAAIGVLASKGSRGLTHRAVDELAGLPFGSTSNLFRTRSALINAIVADLVQDDEARLADISSVLRQGPDVGAYLADFIGETIRTRRDETRARCALLADPDATALTEGRARLSGFLEIQARAADSALPRMAVALALAFADGILIDAVIHGAPFDEAATAAAINRILAEP